MTRILIAEDDPHLREVLCHLVQAAGFEPTAVADGAEALAQLERDTFALMLLDIWMPNVSGLEVLERLRKFASPPKVLVLTADDALETLLQAVRHQAYDYIAKPFDPAALIEAVRQAVAAPTEPGPIEVVCAAPDWVELVVPCHQGMAERAQGFLEHLRADLPEEVRHQVGQAFRELLSNAIEWGGRLDPRRTVRIAYVRFERMLLYRIADPGEGFRLQDLAHAAIGHDSRDPFVHTEIREAKGLRAGGFGLVIAKAYADEVIYNQARNEVILIKYFA
jgi:CheY-like chemotaxis protein/anti-sigma regulatory factor (Ser/Thr protein kinase)